MNRTLKLDFILANVLAIVRGMEAKGNKRPEFCDRVSVRPEISGLLSASADAMFDFAASGNNEPQAIESVSTSMLEPLLILQMSS